MTIHERLEAIGRQVFGDDELPFADDTSARDVPGWDSLAHVTFMFSIEQSFGVELTDEEFADFGTIGELKRILERKLRV